MKRTQIELFEIWAFSLNGEYVVDGRVDDFDGDHILGTSGGFRPKGDHCGFGDDLVPQSVDEVLVKGDHEI